MHPAIGICTQTSVSIISFLSFPVCACASAYVCLCLSLPRTLTVTLGGAADKQPWWRASQQRKKNKCLVQRRRNGNTPTVRRGGQGNTPGVRAPPGRHRRECAGTGPKGPWAVRSDECSIKTAKCFKPGTFCCVGMRKGVAHRKGGILATVGRPE